MYDNVGKIIYCCQWLITRRCAEGASIRQKHWKNYDTALSI